MSDNTVAKKSSSVFSTSSGSKAKRAPGEKRTKQLLLILVLLMCCVASGYLFKATLKIMGERDNIVPDIAAVPDVATTAESKEVQDTEASMRLLGRANNDIMQTANFAQQAGNFPMAPVTALNRVFPAPLISANPLDEPEEPDPPKVSVLAVMIKDKDRVAMVDVEGEYGGLIVRVGSTFSDGAVKITKIDSKGVTFTWMKKSYTVAMLK